MNEFFITLAAASVGAMLFFAGENSGITSERAIWVAAIKTISAGEYQRCTEATNGN